MFPCPICEKKYTNRYVLIKHMYKVHDSIVEYECTFCDFRSPHIKIIERHQGTHPEFIPYKCTECRFTTVSKGQLTKHMKVHTDECFKCKICDRVFATKYNLERHESSLLH